VKSIGPTAVEAGPALRVGVFVELTKPRLSLLAVVAALAGFYMGADTDTRLVAFLGMLIGATFIGASANTLNQLVEHKLDARMNRTAGRPLPSGRLAPPECLWFGVLLAFGGLMVLTVTTNLLATFLAGAILTIYVMLYTPMKRTSRWNTPVGAVPGALPVLLGWAAAGRPLDAGAWALFAVVFVWQLPHFWAICWVHRLDYQRAGYCMLPIGDETGVRTGWWVALGAAALAPVSLLPWLLGLCGPGYAFGALELGIVFALVASRMIVRPSQESARLTFLTSIVYLPVLFGMLMLDKTV